ncbi:MAG: glycosyl transferase family 1, partial [Planctomycetia bacterium]|nr:glycosyl transferase family 1 [Planctomycetia bacterium]
MRVLVTVPHHYLRTPDGHTYSQSSVNYGFWCRYLDVFDEVLVLARVKDIQDVPPQRNRADGPGVTFYGLPDYTGPWQFLLKWFQLKTAVRDAVRACDAYIFRQGTIARLACKEVKRLGQPYALEVVADPWDAFSPGSVRSVIRPIARRHSRRNLRRMCREANAVIYVTRQWLQRSYPAGPNTLSLGCSDVQLDSQFILDDLGEPLERVKCMPNLVHADGPPLRLGFIGSFNQMYKAPDVHIKALRHCVNNGYNLSLAILAALLCFPLVYE